MCMSADPAGLMAHYFFTATPDASTLPHYHHVFPYSALPLPKIGVCCQKVCEAEAMVAGGVLNVLVTNQVVAPGKLLRLARLAAHRGTTVGVLVDAMANASDLSAAAVAAGATLEVYVEVDVGQGRCGVPVDSGFGQVVALAEAVATMPGLK